MSAFPKFVLVAKVIDSSILFCVTYISHPSFRHAVLDRGIYLLDTAPWYGHGTSEKVVGYALDTLLLSGSDDDSNPTRPRTGSLSRSNLIINTKVGRYEADPLKQFDFSYKCVQ